MTTMTITMGSVAATGDGVLGATIGRDRRGAGGTTHILTRNRMAGIIGIAGIVATVGMTDGVVVRTWTAGTIDGTTTAAAGRT